MTDSPGSRGNGPPRRTDRRLWQEEEAPLSPLGRAFLAYWHAKCPPGGGFPARADIAPDEMVRLLPSIFLVDVLPEAAGGCDFHFRLIGTGIVEVEGEHTGERLSALYTKRDADAVVWRQYEDAAAGKVRIRWETLRWPGRGPMQYEVILAPLQDATGRVTMLIGLAHALAG
ncbi:MAG TPA: PAS domain-containing protein [Kiloniellaceae bacterium]